MNNVLIITGRYLPGYKDGGPVRTIKNLTDMYGDKYHFTVVCADRDHGDTKAYDGIKVGKEHNNRVGNADVVYIENGDFKFSDIKYLAGKNDLVYVCGPYNGYAIKALLLNKLGKISCPFVLAPMGSFSAGALALKSTKKKVFLSLMKMCGLFNGVVFSVTSEVEKREMATALGREYTCYVAEDPQRAPGDVIRGNAGDTGIRDYDYTRLRTVFLSRISEKKNLKYAAEILKKVKASVQFDIYGTMEDAAYYDECVSVLNTLPDNVAWEYKGEADSERVPEIMGMYDAFLFPTKGENFGHVISEALSAGAVPIISDTTPWLDLDEKNAGHVLPLNDTDAFVNVIEKLAAMSDDERRAKSECAVKYYREKYEESVKNNGYTKMFEALLGDKK